MAIQAVRIGSLEYLRAESICVPHAFTTRFGGVSKEHLSSLNLGMHRGDDPENVMQNYKIMGSALGFDPEKCVLTRQVHGDVIRCVGTQDCMGLDHGVYPECDGLITDVPGLCLTVFTADCTPVLLYDPVTGAVGAVHAGWRGTSLDIAGKAVRAMADRFGCLPENIRAAIGPNIAQCCFQTDADVPEAMLEAYGDEVREYIRKDGEKYYVNLKAINALSLRRAGAVDIEVSDACTACQSHRFWSHRVTRGLRGSQGAVILCKGGKI